MTRSELVARMRSIANGCQAAELELRAAWWPAPCPRTGPVLHLSQANAILLNAGNEVDPPDSLGELSPESGWSSVVTTIVVFAGIIGVSLSLPRSTIAPAVAIGFVAGEAATRLYVRGYRRRRRAVAARSPVPPPSAERLVADLADLIAASDPGWVEVTPRLRNALWHLERTADEFTHSPQ